MITVHITGHLKDYTGKKRDCQLPEDVGTILGLVVRLDKMFPGIKDRIFDDQDRTRQFVNIFVNGANIRELAQEDTKLKEGDVVYVLPSVAGGDSA
ncbi:MAG: MoaD family protein [Nitrososphaerales archaeon]